MSGQPGATVEGGGLFVESGNYCGRCGTRLPDLLENCDAQGGGGVGFELLAGNVNLYGRGGTGVSITSKVDGTLIHLCGEPGEGHGDVSVRVKLVDDRHYDAWVSGPDGHRHLRGNRPA